MSDEFTGDEFTGDEGRPAPDIAWIVDALRSPAQPDELVDGERIVSAMSEAVVVARKATASPRSGRGRRRFAVLVGAAVVGVGGVAAAGASVSPLDIGAAIFGEERAETDSTVVAATAATSTSMTATVTTTATTTATTATAATAVAVPVVPDDDVRLDDDDHDADGADSLGASDTAIASDGATSTTIECAEGNHGDTVSSVAHETPPGPDHSSAVVNAAHSDCGKTDDAPSTTAAAVETTTVPETSAPNAGNGNNSANPSNTNPANPANTNPANPSNTDPANPANTNPANPSNTNPANPGNARNANDNGAQNNSSANGTSAHGSGNARGPED